MKNNLPFVFRRHLDRWTCDFLQADGSWGEEKTAARFPKRQEVYAFARSVLGPEGWMPKNLNAVRLSYHLSYLVR